MLSCSPVGKHDDLSRFSSRGWNARTAVAQDAQQWMKEGLMDAEFPMIYFRGDNFYPFALDWKENTNGRIMAPGLGIYFMHPSEGKWKLIDVQRQMNYLRQIGLGHTYFRSRFFTENTKGLYDFTINEFDRYPALVPASQDSANGAFKPSHKRGERPATAHMEPGKEQKRKPQRTL